MATKTRKAESAILSIASFFTKRPKPDIPTESTHYGPELPPKIASSQRKSGFDNKWKSAFTWVDETSDGSDMLCTLCICERDEPQAAGLSSFIQTYEFVATLHMMCDILPVLSALSRAFQVVYV